jgi:hypothetical protein
MTRTCTAVAYRLAIVAALVFAYKLGAAVTALEMAEEADLAASWVCTMSDNRLDIRECADVSLRLRAGN